MIGYSGEEFRPFADGVAGNTLDPVDFWYPIAERAVQWFGIKGKEEFMRWTRSHGFEGDQNQMAASCCWDIVRLEGTE